MTILTMEKNLLFKFNLPTGELFYHEKCVARLSVAEGIILVTLLEASCEIIDRDRLLDIAWPNKFVTLNSLNVAIKKIRSVFLPITGECVIITHHRKGFSWNSRWVKCIVGVSIIDNRDNDNLVSFYAASTDVSNETPMEKNPLQIQNDPMELIVNKEREIKVTPVLNKMTIFIPYCVFSGFLILITLFFMVLYSTQVKVMSCQKIKDYKFCGFGPLIETEIPIQLPSGNYIYVNSQRNGFRYVEVK